MMDAMKLKTSYAYSRWTHKHAKREFAHTTMRMLK